MSHLQLDDFDRRLLSAVQQCVPLVREPYAQLAAELGTEEDRVLCRLAELRKPGGIIRQIGGIFDAAGLGYRQTLVALRLPPDRLDRAGRIVGEHPGVSHGYARRHEWNLWFTLAVSPDSRLGLPGTIERLADECGAQGHLSLPTLRRYKLRVRWPMGAGPAETWGEPLAPVTPGSGPPPGLSEQQRSAVRALQRDLAVRYDPFAPPATEAGMEPDALLVHAADFLSVGWMRRFSAVLLHRRAGARANVMVAWRVPEAADAVDAAGRKSARHPAVSHCYLRQTAPQWPWGLFTMIHGATQEDCALTVDEIATTAGLSEHVALRTEREFVKRRPRLFDAAEPAWEDLG